MKGILLLVALTLLPLTPAFTQTEEHQDMANVRTEDGVISIANGPNEQALLTFKESTISLAAEEGLRIADWLKQDKVGSYPAKGPLELIRKEDHVLLTLKPANAEPIKLRLSTDEAYQFGMALAAVRQNVSEAASNQGP